jgi:hypothetical protein
MTLFPVPTKLFSVLVQLAIDEGPVEDQLRLGATDLRAASARPGAASTPTASVSIGLEALAVLGQDWREDTWPGQVRAEA